MDQTMWLIYLHRASSSPPMTNKCSPSRASQLLTGYFSSGSIRRASPKINRQYSAILACCFGLRARRKALWGFFFSQKLLFIVNTEGGQPGWISIILKWYPEYHMHVRTHAHTCTTHVQHAGWLCGVIFNNPDEGTAQPFPVSGAKRFLS